MTGILPRGGRTRRYQKPAAKLHSGQALQQVIGARYSRGRGQQQRAGVRIQPEHRSRKQMHREGQCSNQDSGFTSP